MVETDEIVAIKKVLQDRRYKVRAPRPPETPPCAGLCAPRGPGSGLAALRVRIPAPLLALAATPAHTPPPAQNRELSIMRQLRHSNIVDLKHCFYSKGEKPDELYLNLVLEFVPETVYRINRQFQKRKQHMPLALVKVRRVAGRRPAAACLRRNNCSSPRPSLGPPARQVYMYQLLRSLAYTHAWGICHRDIKPQNLLIDPSSHVLKLCDFGSAKILVQDEPNVSYICSRYYRAPELIFGATKYTTAIGARRAFPLSTAPCHSRPTPSPDVWSAGCVYAELLLGHPLFPGESGVDQLVEIIKVLGTPSRQEIQDMNPNYTEFQFPQIKAHNWTKVFRNSVPADAINLLESMLKYKPLERIHPLEALLHPFFDELREPGTVLPEGIELPPLFDFTSTEMSIAPELNERLIPEHVRTEKNWPPRVGSNAPIGIRHAPFNSASRPAANAAPAAAAAAAPAAASGAAR